MWSVRPFNPICGVVVARVDEVTERLVGGEPGVIRLPDERVCCRLGAAVERTDGVIDRLVIRLGLRTDGATDRIAGLEEIDGRNDGRAPNEDMRGVPPKRGPPPK